MAAPSASHERGSKSILRPLTANNIYSYYLPLTGALSYSTFSASVFIPDVTSRLFHDQNPVALNALFFNAHLGAGLYLYTRPHIRSAPISYRLIYSVYGSVLFNFGSVLLWSVTKSILPENDIIRAVFSLSTSLFMLCVGKEYLAYVESKTQN